MSSTTFPSRTFRNGRTFPIIRWRLPEDAEGVARFTAPITKWTISTQLIELWFRQQGFPYEVALRRIGEQLYHGFWVSEYEEGDIERKEECRLELTATVNGATLHLEGDWPESGKIYVCRTELPLHSNERQQLGGL